MAKMSKLDVFEYIDFLQTYVCRVQLCIMHVFLNTIRDTLNI